MITFLVGVLFESIDSFALYDILFMNKNIDIYKNGLINSKHAMRWS